MKVAKFGGSSLADGKQIRKVCDIILADTDRRVIVVSAPGKRDADDVKVTDMLIACAETVLAGKDASDAVAGIMGRFTSIREDLNLPESVLSAIRERLDAAVALDQSHPGKFMDNMKALGEDCSALVVSETLRTLGADASYVNPGEAGMLLSDEFGQAELLEESYDRLSALAERDGITVVPGFFGHTRGGDVATFPRGGSDITGAILARAVNADAYENFTDVDCVLSVDPRLVDSAAPINEMTFNEMRELAYAGFSVFHAEALYPVVVKEIPVNIRNTNNPDAPGTWVRAEREHVYGRVLGVASASGFVAINMRKYLMNREVGFGRRLLEIIEGEGLTYEHMPSGIDTVSLIMKGEFIDSEIEARVCQRIREELKVDEIEIEHGLTLVMIVDEGMHKAVGVAREATKALASAGVNIEMMNQGASEISMMFGVKETEQKQAVVALHQAFFAN